MIGTWEDFEVEVNSRDQLLYGVFSGTPAHKVDEPDYYDPICHGAYTDRKVAEHAAKPETMWEAHNCPPKFVLPFRLGWKFDRYFPMESPGRQTSCRPATAPPLSNKGGVQPPPGASALAGLD